MVFTNPRLNPESLKRFYSKIGAYDDRPSTKDLDHRFDLLRRIDLLTYYFKYPILKVSRIKKLIQYPNYLRIRRLWKSILFIPKYKKNGKILDIGCAYGGFLYKLKKLGWEVKGIELSEEAVEYCINNYKLNVEKVSIEEYQTDEKFDIIYLRNVLEHIESPKKALTKIVSFLKPEGLLIISLPDFSGLEVRLFKKYSYCLQLPFHLYHFTPNTLDNYLKLVGLESQGLFHIKTDREIIGPLSYILIKHPNKLLIKFILKILSKKIVRRTLLHGLLNIQAFIGKTSRMTIIAKKI
ncbi:MAG: class I SAM-dependent methyltransferase [Candidatus Hodarchaeota archaeon]